MKYTALRALILVGFAASVSGCYTYDPNYDVHRVHDIYRQDYKYKQPPEAQEGGTAPASPEPPPPPAQDQGTTTPPSPGTAPAPAPPQ